MDQYLSTKQAAEILEVEQQTARKFLVKPDLVKAKGMGRKCHFYKRGRVLDIKYQRAAGTFKPPKIKAKEKKPCHSCGKPTAKSTQICKDCVGIYEVEDFFGVKIPPKTQERPCPICKAKGLLEGEYVCRKCSVNWNQDAEIDTAEAYGQVNL